MLAALATSLLLLQAMPLGASAATTAPDGSGTIQVSPASMTAGAGSGNLTFDYQAATGGDLVGFIHFMGGAKAQRIAFVHIQRETQGSRYGHILLGGLDVHVLPI